MQWFLQVLQLPQCSQKNIHWCKNIHTHAKLVHFVFFLFIVFILLLYCFCTHTSLWEFQSTPHGAL